MAKKTTAKKAPQKTNTRDAILKAAWEMVQQEGWQALSIRRIAEAISYSIPVVYDHFEKKEAILQEFCLRGYQQLAADIATAATLRKKPARQLEDITRAYFHFAQQHKEYYQLMFGMGMPLSHDAIDIPAMKEFTGTVENIMADLLKEHKHKHTDPRLKVRIWWGMVHGAIAITQATAQAWHSTDTPEIIEEVTNTFLKSLEK